MKNFVIITDSCCDLDKETRQKLDIDYVKFTVLCKDEEYECSLDWDAAFTAKEFYDRMRKGDPFKTTQIQQNRFEEIFTKYLEAGKDILYLSVSSALSGSFNLSCKVAEGLSRKYAGRKIVCIDSLSCDGGQGLMVWKASDMRAAGKSLEEVAAWIEEHKLHFSQFATVQDLVYLKRAGRVTGMKEIMSKIFNIKPIIISNAKGENQSIMKVKGRQLSLHKIVSLCKENIIGADGQTVFISHADCESDALAVKQMLTDEVKPKDVHIATVNPTAGASGGPGMFCVYFFGKKVETTTD